MARSARIALAVAAAAALARSAAAQSVPTGTVGGQPVFLACPAIPQTAGVRCGDLFGTRCPGDACCSVFGWCSEAPDLLGEAWCGAGCQLGYGTCLRAADVAADIPCPTSTPPTSFTEYQLTTVSAGTTIYQPCPTIPPTTGARCGSEFGSRCPDWSCCSAYGWCQPALGVDEQPYCGTGCQVLFGRCLVGDGPVSTGLVCDVTTTVAPTDPTPPPTESPTGTETTSTRPLFTLTTVSSGTTVYTACPELPVSENGRCGAEFNTRCPNNLCCSTLGFCQDDGGDSGWEWCGYPPCQVGFGKCFLVPFADAPAEPAYFECPDPEPTIGPGVSTTVSSGTPVYVACTSLPLAEDNRCGADLGTRCRNNQCCHRTGFCFNEEGSQLTINMCTDSCQRGYGKCLVGNETAGPLVCPPSTATVVRTTTETFVQPTPTLLPTNGVTTGSVQPPSASLDPDSVTSFSVPRTTGTATASLEPLTPATTLTGAATTGAVPGTTASVTAAARRRRW